MTTIRTACIVGAVTQPSQYLFMVTIHQNAHISSDNCRMPSRFDR